MKRKKNRNGKKYTYERIGSGEGSEREREEKNTESVIRTPYETRKIYEYMREDDARNKVEKEEAIEQQQPQQEHNKKVYKQHTNECVSGGDII